MNCSKFYLNTNLIAKINMVVIAGFGNPLLDLTVKVTNDTFTLLNKYNITPNEHAEISAQQMKNLINDIQELCPIVTPGGSTQNTLRIIQWLMVTPKSTIMYGAIGCDEQGETLKTLVEMADVETRYIQKPGEPTGLSVALVNGEIRTLIAHIGAAQNIQLADFKSKDILSGVDLVYMEAFFLTLRVPVAKHVQEICVQHKIPFAFNLSAIYMTNMFTFDVLYFAENCDILIGNYNEYKGLIQALNLPDDVKSFAVRLSKKHANLNGLKYGKMCVITNGSQQIIGVHSGDITEIERVKKLEPDNLVDTTGAGDAFAAGFLFAFLKGRTPKQCLQWGCMVANEIIQQTGCTIPINKPAFLKI